MLIPVNELPGWAIVTMLGSFTAFMFLLTKGHPNIAIAALMGGFMAVGVIRQFQYGRAVRNEERVRIQRRKWGSAPPPPGESGQPPGPNDYFGPNR